MSLQIGQKAPRFTLYNTEKRLVSLDDYKGKNVLLLFFPLAFTSTCTIELCSVRDNLFEFSNKNAEVIGISVDSLYSLAAYKKDQGYNFTLLSDFNKETSVAYKTIYDIFSYGMHGVSKRSAFIIDKEGIIRYVEVLENAGEIPDFETIHTTLAGLN